MSKSKLVYDDDRIEELTFVDGFSTGFEACKDGLVNWRPRMGLQGYWLAVMLLFCVPIVGQIIALLRIQNAYAGAMRYEQLLLAGRRPGFKDAWSVFWTDLGLTKLSVMTFGMMLGGQIAGGFVAEIPYLSFIAALATMVGVPVLTGSLTLASWSVALQGSDKDKALDKFPEIVKKGWAGLAGQLAFMWVVTLLIVMAMIVCGVAVGGAIMFSGGGGFWLGLIFGLAMLLASSAAILPLFGLGFHLLGRKMMMRRVEIPDDVAAPAFAAAAGPFAVPSHPAAQDASPSAPIGPPPLPAPPSIPGDDGPINPINPN